MSKSSLFRILLSIIFPTLMKISLRQRVWDYMLSAKTYDLNKWPRRKRETKETVE